MNAPACLSSAALAAALLLSSCSLPPREAWQAIQRDGLFGYMGSPTPGYTPSSRYLASSGQPFGTHAYRDTRPAPTRSAVVPYRQEYRPNRYLADDRDRPAPVRPPLRRSSTKTVAESSSKVREHIDPSEPVVKTTPSNEVAKEKSAPSSSPTSDSVAIVKPVPTAADALPYGSPVAGRPGMVTSPYATKQQLVDIAGMSTGQTVKCPYTGKLFRVPPTEQAAAKTTESPAIKAPEEPKTTPQ